MEISEKELDNSLQMNDSDSNMVTASEGYTSSCSPTSANSNPSETPSSKGLSLDSVSLQDPILGQESSQDEFVCSSEERESFGKRGDADGCSLTNSDETNVKGTAETEETDVDLLLQAQLEELTIAQDPESECKKDDDSTNCPCKRSESNSFEDNNLAIQGAWNELRSAIRQLYRRVVPSQNKNVVNHSRNRPSLNRIKALSNMLFNHDPHQLFTRACQLSQEFCIELKVRLLATIHDSPDLDEASSFIQGLCESYQWVMGACEAVQGAFEKLDAEHLSLFGLNWMTVNMHTFYTSVYTDLDVQDYLNTCTTKAGETPLGEETLGCLASLKRTLTVSESIWQRAESHLQEYTMERAALNIQRRQLLADWGGHSKLHTSLGKYFLQKHLNGTSTTACANNHVPHKGCEESKEACLSSYGDRPPQNCPCSNCLADSDCNHKDLAQTLFSKEMQGGKRSDSPGGCECHFCNSSLPQLANNMLSSSGSGTAALPPLTQPQLSLYPHIHGTAVAVSDIVPSSPLDDLGPIPGSSSNSKPPLFSNPYLGSDLLTEQLIREWDSAYGDALSLPGSTPVSSINNGSIDSQSSLVNGIDNLCINSRPSYANQMIDHSLPFIPDAISVASAQTSMVSSIEGPNSPLPLSTSPAGICSTATSSLHSHTPTTMSTSPASLTPPPIASSGEWRSSSLPCKNEFLKCKSLTPNPHNGESVITHTKSYNQSSAPLLKGSSCENHSFSDRGEVLRSEDNSTSRETPSETETSGHDEWSTGDDSDSSENSLSNHDESHCNCCYCHMLQNKQGGGRQKYSDRRERLLKILSRKKKANTSSSSSSNTSTVASGSSTVKPTSAENSLGQQTLDEILNFIEGRRFNESSCAKKAAKKARQKEKKLVALRKKHPIASLTNNKEKALENSEDEEFEDDDLEDEDLDLKAEEEEDGPLAELRRRAPDVTITVVKPGQRQAAQPPRAPQMSLTRDTSNLPLENSKHPLAAKPLPGPNSMKKDSWTNPTSRPLLPSSLGPLGGFPTAPSNSSMGDGGSNKFSSSAPPPVGLSNLLKNMDTSNKDKEQDADGKSSQMVTIRRVMDPVSAEPTVTITLKGEEPNKDKVLFKLVNGKGASAGNKEQPANQPAKQKKTPQVKPVYNIPPGTSPEEAKKMKKQQKKERQRQRKEEEKLEEEKKEQLQQLQLKKQQEFLRQQEKQIKQQQAALQRQQEELLKKKQLSQTGQSKKKGKKAKKSNESSNNPKTPIVGYESDDVARNFNLPPGVSISKVAGQPGMVTISNNMSGNFGQPFLPNPSLYRSSLLPGFSGSPPSYNVGGAPPVDYSGLYGGCSPNMPWNSSVDPCNGSPEESVIVVDTKAGAKGSQASKKSKPNVKASSSDPKSKNAKKPVKKMISKKVFEKLSSEDKVVSAVKGEADTAWLNQTQKKKYKKALKAIKEEKDKALAKQREEDDLMDQMYEIAKGQQTPRQIAISKASKVSKGSDASSNVSIRNPQGNQKKNQEAAKSTKAKSKEQHDTNNKKSNNTSKQKGIANQQSSSLVSQKQVPNQKQASQQHSKSSSLLQNQSKSNTQKNWQKQSSSTTAGSKGSGNQQKHLNQQTSQKQLQQSNNQKGQASQNQGLQSKQTSSSKNQNSQAKNSNSQVKSQNTQEKSSLQKQQGNGNKQQMNSQKHLPQQQVKQANQKQTTQSKQTHLQVNAHAPTLPSNAKSGQGKQTLQQQKQTLSKKQQQQLTAPMLQKHAANFCNMVDLKHQYQSDKNAGVNYTQTLGYSNDIGHEARYAQYLAANASTLAAVESNYSNFTNHDDDHPISKKARKKGKKGVVEDLPTIDSVFTPKDVTGGELDETEREVEAFKRFCLYNVPRNTGQKPKVNFNVKDIMFKNRHGGI